MRIAGLFLLLCGIVAIAFGTFTGCGSLFTWNGRHAIETRALDESGAAIVHELRPEPGRRYTIAIQVVFDREGLPRRDGSVEVAAQMPIVVTVRDNAGTSLASVAGFIDPNEPPNVLYGQNAKEPSQPVGAQPHRAAAATQDLVVERLVGPFLAASNAPLKIDVNLGADRVGTARIVSRRMVIHDDTLPSTIKNAFIVAAVGGVMLVTATVLLVVGWLRRRRRRRAKSAGASSKTGSRKLRSV